MASVVIQVSVPLCHFGEDGIAGNHLALLPRCHCILPWDHIRTFLLYFILDLFLNIRR